MYHVRFGATPQDLHIDALLSNVAVGYRPRGIIAPELFPVVEVGKQSDHYAIFSRADMLRVDDTKRAPGTEAKKVETTPSSDTYYAENYALKYPVTIEDRANADPIFVTKLINGRVEFITGKLLLDWEKRVSLQVTSGTNVGSTAAVSSVWNDAASGNSDPLGDIWTAIGNVEDSQGVRPNKIVFGTEPWRQFRKHYDVRNVLFGVDNGGGYASTAQVANLFDMENVLVGGAYQNTGAEGQSEALSSIWGGNVLIYYAPQSPSINEPSLGYSFRWTGNGLPNMQVERHPYDAKTKSEEVETGYYQAEKITGVGYGFLLTGAVT